MLNTATIVGFVGFCERYEETLGRVWRETGDGALEMFKAEVEVRIGRPPSS